MAKTGRPWAREPSEVLAILEPRLKRGMSFQAACNDGALSYDMARRMYKQLEDFRNMVDAYRAHMPSLVSDIVYAELLTISEKMKDERKGGAKVLLQKQDRDFLIECIRNLKVLRSLTKDEPDEEVELPLKFETPKTETEADLLARLVNKHYEYKRARSSRSNRRPE